MLKDCAYLLVVSALHRDEVIGKFRHLGSCLVWEVCRSSVGSGLTSHADSGPKYSPFPEGGCFYSEKGQKKQGCTPDPHCAAGPRFQEFMN